MRPLRHFRHEVTFTFPNGAAGGALIQSQQLPLEGEILHIKQINSSNTNARTAQLTIVDTNAIVMFDGTAKAHNASHDHEFGLNMRRALRSDDTLKCTISGDPGASGYTVKAIISLFGRDG